MQTSAQGETVNRLNYTDQDRWRAREALLVLAEAYARGIRSPEERRRQLQEARDENRLPEDWRDLLRWLAEDLEV